ncbi:MAG: DUF192 domain-containing protein [Candidatus Sericytochromatia bacterium]|nr:DUF192 domain-containing protein [Candidatus Sericytochromatia bacterium]
MGAPASLRLTCERTGEALAERVGIASNFWSRLIGLLGTPHLPPDAGLLIVPCNSVHTFGMRYAIDIVYLTEAGVVIATTEHMKPWTFGWPIRAAKAVLELPAGTVQRAGLQAGDRLSGWPAPTPS